MSQLGLQFANQESLSPSRMDSKTLFWGTGQQIADLPSASEYRFALCISTEAGFVENTFYGRTADKSAWFPIFNKHKHEQDTPAAGGKLSDILMANQKTTRKFSFYDARQIRGTSTGGSSPAIGNVNLNQTSYIDCSTSTTSSAYSNFWLNEGLRIDLSKKFSFSFKIQLSHNSNLVFRLGPGAFQAQTAVSPSNMVWVEGCNASGVNFIAGVSNGLSVNTQASTTNMIITPTNASRGHNLSFIPATKVIYSNDSGGGGVELTSSVPSSSYVATETTIKGGIQTTNAGTAKSLFIWNCDLVYEVGSGESWI